MKTGRPSKPTALKLIAGNPGKRAINAQEPDAGDADLSPPVELTQAARVHWERLAPMLARSGVLKQSDRDLLATYAECYAAFQASVAAGKINVSLVGQCRQMLGEMGMTPAARSRIIADKVPEGGDGKRRFFAV